MRIIIAGLCLAVSGCVAPMQPGQAQAITDSAADWELCYIAVTGQGQPALRQATYNTMRARKTDCNQHVGMVQAKIAADSAKSARDQADIAQGLRLLGASRGQPATPSQSSGGATAFLKREYESGFNRICIYDRVGSEVAITINATQICPLKI